MKTINSIMRKCANMNEITELFYDFYDTAEWSGELADGKYVNMTIWDGWLILYHKETKKLHFIDPDNQLISFQIIGPNMKNMRLI